MGWTSNIIFYGSTQNYGDYLQERENLHEVVTRPISQEMAKIVGAIDVSNVSKIDGTEQVQSSLHNLSDNIIEQSQAIVEAQYQQSMHLMDLYSELGYQTDSIRHMAISLEGLDHELSGLRAEAREGLDRIALRLDDIQISLAEMVRIANSPSQTWALEQFDIARQAYELGEYEEALRYVSQAIDGFSSNSGYSLDYRFHYLKGLICTEDVELTDKARFNFLKSAKLARSVRSKSESFCMAGLSAYSMDVHNSGYTDLKSAYASDPSYLRAGYLLAQAHFRHGNSIAGKKLLSEIFEKDKAYIKIAYADPGTINFARDRDVVVKNIYESLVRKSQLNWINRISKISKDDKKAAECFPTTKVMTETAVGHINEWYDPSKSIEDLDIAIDGTETFVDGVKKIIAETLKVEEKDIKSDIEDLKKQSQQNKEKQISPALSDHTVRSQYIQSKEGLVKEGENFVRNLTFAFGFIIAFGVSVIFYEENGGLPIALVSGVIFGIIHGFITRFFLSLLFVPIYSKAKRASISSDADAELKRVKAKRVNVVNKFHEKRNKISDSIGAELEKKTRS